MLRRLRSIPRDLGLQLFIVYLLLIVPFLTSLAMFDQFVGQRIRADVESTDLSLVQALAQETDHSLRNAMEVVRGLSAYEGVISADKPSMEPLFALILNTRPGIDLVYRLDSAGRMFYHYPVGPGSTVGTDFSFRTYYQNARLSHEPLISEGRISPTTEQAVATAVMPIWSRNGDFLGVVATNIRLESLSATLSTITASHQSNEEFQVAIVDSSGQVIAFPDQSLLLHSLTELAPGLSNLRTTDRAGTIIARDMEGQQRLYTYATIPSAGWRVIASRSAASAFGTQEILRRVSLTIAVSFLLIGLVFWVALNRRVIRPIEQLVPISQALGRNQQINESERKVLQDIQRRPDQIGHLVRSTLRMEESIRARMREQATLLDTSKAVVSTLDLEAVLDRILDQVERLLTVKMSAIVAHDPATGLFKIRASHGLSKKFADQLTIQPYEPSSVTVRALHSREPIQVSDTEQDPSYVPRRPRARAEGFRSVLAVPLNTKHAPPTALVLYRRDPHVFTEEEIALLVSFANQATMAIENATLFERSDARLQEQTRRLEALIQSLSDGLILSRPDQTVAYANRRVAELADLSQDEIYGMAVERVVDRILAKSTETEAAKLRFKQSIPIPDPTKPEISIQDQDRTLYLRLETFDVRDGRELLIGRGLFFHDITADSELDRMKTSLVSTVSHELRTPLAAIKGYATTLLAEDVQWDPAAQREFLNVISDESDRLSGLVNDLLDLSRIEAGNLRVSWVNCDPGELGANAARQARLAFPGRLHIHTQAGLPPFLADPARIETILRNLFENSLKYGGSGVSVQLSVEMAHEAFIFRIHDNGPGIPAEESARVFERFYRIDDSLARVSSGAGLGLAICRGLVRAHGGEIWVEPVESGACIAFSIPVLSRVPHEEDETES